MASRHFKDGRVEIELLVQEMQEYFTNLDSYMDVLIRQGTRHREGMDGYSRGLQELINAGIRATYQEEGFPLMGKPIKVEEVYLVPHEKARQSGEEGLSLRVKTDALERLGLNRHVATVFQLLEARLNDDVTPDRNTFVGVKPYDADNAMELLQLYSAPG